MRYEGKQEIITCTLVKMQAMKTAWESNPLLDLTGKCIHRTNEKHD